MSRIERVPDIFRLDVKAINVIEPAVPSLGHNGQAPPVAGRIGRSVLDAPGNDRVARHADAMRVRDDDWSFEKPALLNPGCAGHLAVSIQAEEARVNRIIKRSPPARQNRGNTGAHRAFANLEFAFAADQCRIANFDASDIRDRVKFPRRAFKRNPEIARANRLAYDSVFGGGDFCGSRAEASSRLQARPRAGGEQTASMSLVIHQLSAINHQLGFAATH